MMAVEEPETCWVTHKRQVMNLWNCCIWLVNLFEFYDDARTCQRQTGYYRCHSEPCSADRIAWKGWGYWKSSVWCGNSYTAAANRDRCKELLTRCVKGFAQSNLKCRLSTPTWSPSIVLWYFPIHCTLVISQHGVEKKHIDELYWWRQKRVAFGGRCLRDW